MVHLPTVHLYRLGLASQGKAHLAQVTLEKGVDVEPKRRALESVTGTIETNIIPATCVEMVMCRKGVLSCSLLLPSCIFRLTRS